MQLFSCLSTSFWTDIFLDFPLARTPRFREGKNDKAPVSGRGGNGPKAGLASPAIESKLHVPRAIPEIRRGSVKSLEIRRLKARIEECCQIWKKHSESRASRFGIVVFRGAGRPWLLRGGARGRFAPLRAPPKRWPRSSVARTARRFIHVLGVVFSLKSFAFFASSI